MAVVDDSCLAVYLKIIFIKKSSIFFTRNKKNSSNLTDFFLGYMVLGHMYEEWHVCHCTQILCTHLVELLWFIFSDDFDYDYNSK